MIYFYSKGSNGMTNPVRKNMSSESTLLKNITKRLVRGNVRMQRGFFDSPATWKEKKDQHVEKLKRVSHLLYPEKF